MKKLSLPQIILLYEISDGSPYGTPLLKTPTLTALFKKGFIDILDWDYNAVPAYFTVRTHVTKQGCEWIETHEVSDEEAEYYAAMEIEQS